MISYKKYALLFSLCLLAPQPSIAKGLKKLPLDAPLLARAAERVGITQCLDAIYIASKQFDNGYKKTNVVMDWDKKKPNKSPLFSLTGIDNNGYPSLSSVTIIPNAKVSNQCTYLIEQTSTAPIKCELFEKKDLEDYKKTELVKNINVYTNNSKSNTQVILTDIPNGCLVMRRESGFNVSFK